MLFWNIVIHLPEYRVSFPVNGIVIVIITFYLSKDGPGSVVGIATAYGLDSPGIESPWGEIFCTSPDLPWGPPSILYNGYRVFPGGKVLLGRDADPLTPF